MYPDYPLWRDQAQEEEEQGTIIGDDKRFCHQINADEVFGTHRPGVRISPGAPVFSTSQLLFTRVGNDKELDRVARRVTESTAGERR
jgi:hypothetical protein